MILQGENIISGGSSVPIGTIIATVSDTPDIGYAFCHGQALSRQTYAIIFSKIGTKYGTGNGSTTFNLPDCREVSLVGAGTNVLNSAQIEAHDALTAGQFQDDQMQGHWHQIGYYNVSAPVSGGTALTIGSTNGIHNESVRSPVTDKVNGTPREGPTTHGKQLGVNYQIKILN